MRIDVWSDVVCPWCYIGKRRLERAVAEFEHRDEVEVRWRAFELDPNAPPAREESSQERLSRKYGMSTEQVRVAQQRVVDLAADEGLRYQLDSTQSGNTFNAHRIISLGAARGIQSQVQERLFAAYLSEGRAIGDGVELLEIATSAGLDPSEVTDLLGGTAFAAEVRADEAQAAEREITGVPYFLVDGRFAIPGAQEPDTILAVLRRARAKAS